jgi:ketosteroid isomerase-like protein
MTTSTDQLASSFFGALEQGDIAAVAALYDPQVAVWHNYDRTAQTRDENLATLAWVVGNVANRRYEVVERIVVDDGFVQQHVLHGDAAGGHLELPAMMRVTVGDGLITRIDEYLDTRQLRVLRATAGTARTHEES